MSPNHSAWRCCPDPHLEEEEDQEDEDEEAEEEGEEEGREEGKEVKKEEEEEIKTPSGFSQGFPVVPQGSRSQQDKRWETMLCNVVLISCTFYGTCTVKMLPSMSHMQSTFCYSSFVAHWG